MRGEKFDNTPSPERVNTVGEIIHGLMKIVEEDKLQEVESAQPENLTQEEARDTDGNEITYIRNKNSNNNDLASPIEIRDVKGELIAQSWNGKDWSVDRYIENGIDFKV